MRRFMVNLDADFVTDLKRRDFRIGGWPGRFESSQPAESRTRCGERFHRKSIINIYLPVDCPPDMFDLNQRRVKFAKFIRFHAMSRDGNLRVDARLA